MATPLLLLVHGRTGGVIPEVYQRLARELEQRRQAPVGLRALTAPPPEPGDEPAMGEVELTLVPLLLLPGNHARVDVPALARELCATAGAALRAAGVGLDVAVAGAEPSAGRGRGPGARGAEAVAAGRNHGPGGEGVPAPGPEVRRLPFLGAWPAWQSALAAELTALGDSTDGAGRLPAEPPLLLHHPLEGHLAPRYLEHLQRRLGCRCLAAPYSSADSEEPALAIDGPVLPLALAANRLTERLEPRFGRVQAAPLLERPRLLQLLLEQLAALP